MRDEPAVACLPGGRPLRSRVLLALLAIASLALAPAQGPAWANVNDEPAEVFDDGNCLRFFQTVFCAGAPFWRITISTRLFDVQPEPQPLLPIVDDLPDSELWGLRLTNDPVNQGVRVCGNPINVSTGNKVQQEVDYVGVGRFPLTFSRTFNSAQPALLATPLGAKWSFGVPRLDDWISSFGQQGVGWMGKILIRPDGQRVKLRANDGPVMPGTSDVTSYFTRTNGKRVRLYQTESRGWVYFERTMEYRFDNLGRLTIQIDRPTGEYHQYAYPTPTARYPSTITHSSGRTLTFAYDQGRLISLTDPAGSIISYEYNADDNVDLVRYPATAAGVGTKEYFYEDPNYPDHLTRRVDEVGAWKVWTYDNDGNATSSALANGLGKFEILSRTFSNGQWTVRTRNALGREAEHVFETIAGNQKIVATHGELLGNCEATSESITY